MQPRSSYFAPRATLIGLLLGVIGGWSHAQISINGPIYDGNGGPLLSSEIYVVTGDISFPPGETRTVQDDVIVKFDSGMRLTVDGTLLVNGTSSAPSVFTSYADDSTGGDTNGDGPSAGQPGDWGSIHFEPTSGASTLDWTEVWFAGDGNHASIEIDEANIALGNCFLTLGSAAGIDLNGSEALPAITSCEITDHQTCAIEGASLDAIPGFSGNTASGNSDGDSLLLALPSPTADVIISADNCLNSTLVYASHWGIPTGVTVTIRKGVILKAATSYSKVTVHGSLLTFGSASSPVVFTSLADDDYGGDTNGDGPSSGTTTDWQGIQLELNGAYSKLKHTVVRYSGYNYRCGIISRGMQRFTLYHVTIRDCFGGGLDLNGLPAKPSVVRCTFQDNGGHAVVAAPIDAVPGFQSNRAFGNGNGDYIDVYPGDPVADVTLSEENAINGALVIRGGCAVPAGVTMNVNPGTVLKFTGVSTQCLAEGSLNLRGTSADPVVLTSINDDEYGGDTNGDGSSSGNRIDWMGLHYPANAEASTLENVIVRYAGLSNSTIRLFSPLVSARAIRAEHAYGNGITAEALAGDAVNWIARDCPAAGIELAGGAFDIVHATASDCLQGILKSGTENVNP